MCHTSPHRHALHCIVPPYLLRRIAINGSRTQRERAAYAMGRDATFRSLRVGPSLIAALGLRRLPALAVVGQKQRTIYTLQQPKTWLLRSWRVPKAMRPQAMQR